MGSFTIMQRSDVMMQIGRRILFNKVTGKIICDLGEMQGDVLPRENLNEKDIGIIELDYGQYAEEFSRATSIRVNPETRELLFELREKVLSPEQQIIELENQLLVLSGVI